VIARPQGAGLSGSRILFRDGVPIATLIAGGVDVLEKMEPAAEWAARKLILRDRSRSAPADAQTAATDG